MKFFTITFYFTLFALSVADYYCSVPTLRECVPIKNCPSVWNKVVELEHPDSKNLLLAFLRYVRYVYYCDCYANDGEPAVTCPDKLPEGFSQLVPNKPKDKELLAKEQKRKKLLEICGTPHTSRMLVDGNRADLTDYPWLVRLQFENTMTGERKFLCGGVLITNRHVLTAAHCVTSPSNVLISVRLGEHDTTTGAPKDVEVAEYVVHEDYNDGPSPRFLDADDPSDLALIKLRKEVRPGEGPRPICLPQRAELPKQRYEVAGWSTTMAPNAQGLPQKLHSAISGISSNKCRRYPINHAYTSSDHICAGGTSGQACVADAGGPLMAQEAKGDGKSRMTVFGIAFMELPCSLVKFDMPGIFTKVHKYVPWIEERIFQSDV